MDSAAHPQVAIVEADGIQQWILGTSTELRVIRGGSLLLDAAFTQIRTALEQLLGPPHPPSDEPPAEGWQLLVGSSGAMTLALGGRADPVAVRDRIRSVLAREVPDLPVRFGTAAWQGSFTEARRSAIRNARSLRTVTVATHVPGTWACTSCGAASGARDGRRPGAGADAWHLCAACERRAGLTHDAAEHLPGGVHAEYELNRIGAATPSGRWEGYVGIVSADGNAIGQRFARLSEAGELADASQQLKDKLTDNVHAALAAASQDDAGSQSLPVNLLMQAGDDIRMILPAHVALTAAARLCDSPQLPGCAGVVITHASMPFFDAHEHAEQLLDRDAKRSARARCPQQPPAVVSFAVESGSRPRRPSEHPDPITATPYLAADLQAVIAAADTLTVSNHALRAVSEALHAGGRIAEREWQLFLARCSNDDHAVLARLWERFKRDAREPWVTEDHRSPVGDLLLLRSLRRREGKK